MLGFAMIVWLVTFLLCMSYKGGLGDFVIFLIAGIFISSVLGIGLSVYLGNDETNSNAILGFIGPITERIGIFLVVIGVICACIALWQKGKKAATPKE